ncbi:MAG TPA: hypothetical protein VGY76_10680 [Solirubrobacteraceae bacterium]|jgi:hypothetical protein|nr:hypothetical protein [Solirubrobacteraceae bacterium]
MNATLPVSTFKDAYPYLRAPLTSDLVYGLIQTVPKDLNVPCTIGLYTISEALTDRLTIICGGAWSQESKVLVHRTAQKDGRTIHYMEVEATIEVFGVVRHDFGKSMHEDPGQCRMNAKAQAFKRACRWVGLGLYLYSIRPYIKMWRGTGEGKLRIPNGGNDPHMRPFIDLAAEDYIRKQYEQRLAVRITKIYGHPLDHLLAAGVAEVPVIDPSRTLASAQPRLIDPPPPAPDDQAKTTQVRTAHRSRLQADIGRTAVDAGYTEVVAVQLDQLVRSEGQAGALSAAQIRTVRSWIATIARMKLPEETVLKTIDFVLEKCATRERAQAKFVKWLSAKAMDGHGTQASEPNERHGPSRASAVVSDTPAIQPQDPTQDTVAIESPESAQMAPSEPPEEVLADLLGRATYYGYPESVIVHLRSLALGASPDADIDWATVPVEAIRKLSDVLDHAGLLLKWTPAQLDAEIMRAHSSGPQCTAAGRFAALARYVTEASATHAEEAQRSAVGALA